MDRARPAFDPELKAGLAVVGGVFPPTDSVGVIPALRSVVRSHPELLSGRLAALTESDDARRTEYLSTLRAVFDAAGGRPAVAGRP